MNTSETHGQGKKGKKQMKAKLMINDKKFEVEISEEQAQALTKTKKKTGYERVKKGQCFYVETVDGTPLHYVKDNYECEGRIDEGANYYSDVTIAENNARADKLYRQLRRFAVEHRKTAIDWNNEDEEKWCIFFEHSYEGLVVDYLDSNQHFGSIYFDSKETARRAIDTFKDELIWYFTGYKDSL